jgi:hypothetical protein
VLLTALAEPGRALAAWQELRPELDLQTIEDSVFAALPLVYRRLDGAGLDDPDLLRLKGIYRNTWTRNALLVERLRATAESFRAADVPMLLVGTLGAALRYYDSLGLRPTGYLELLVSEDDLTRGVRALGSAGWSTRGASRRRPAAPLPLVDGEGRLCLLRTGLAPDFAAPSREPAEAPFWDAAADVESTGLRVRALSPGDDLLATIVMGARANPFRSVQWLVDAAMILRAPEQIDWDRLCRTGIERGQGLRLRDALGYLQQLLGSAPPTAVQESLDRRKPSARERLTYACTARAFPGLEPLGEHLGATSGRSAWATAGTLPGFFRNRWDLEHTWQVPVDGGRRVVRRVLRRPVAPGDAE